MLKYRLLKQYKIKLEDNGMRVKRGTYVCTNVTLNHLQHRKGSGRECVDVLICKQKGSCVKLLSTHYEVTNEYKRR